MWTPPADQVESVNSGWKPPMDQVANIDQPDPSFMETVGSAAKNALVAPAKFAKKMANPETGSEYLPTLGAMTGNPIVAGGTAIAGRMADLAYGRKQPGDIGTPLQEAVGPMAQTALVGLPEVKGVKDAIQSTAQNLGRRALGFTKGMIKRTPGGIDTLNNTAQQMLDKEVIQFGSGAEATLERAKDVAKTSGKQVGSALSQAGDNAMNAQDVAGIVTDQLTPKYSGGAYDAEKGVVEEIKNTIMAHGDGPIDFRSAQDLKNKLGDLAKFNSLTDQTKANMYRRAYGIVSDAIEQGLGNAKASALPGYIANKETYGASQRAIQGLSDKAAGEASNSLLSLRGAAIAAGSLAAGHVTPAVEALGTWEAARRVGAASGSAALNTLNKSQIIPAAKNAIIAEYIRRHGNNNASR